MSKITSDYLNDKPIGYILLGKNIVSKTLFEIIKCDEGRGVIRDIGSNDYQQVKLLGKNKFELVDETHPSEYMNSQASKLTKTCTCPMMNLLQQGCTCGHIRRYNPK